MITGQHVPDQIHSVDQIDFNLHGVIEASAGTGKTYTIEHLVVELLKTGKVQSLDQILVVTFTDKAVGELKNRIRNIIRNSLEQQPSEILYSSFENFDSASIYTIHGFCNKVINDYAFENGKHLSNRLVNDRQVYEQELSIIKRDMWPQLYGDRLREVLNISDYPGSTRTGTSSWEDLVMDLALRYQVSGFDRIVPPVESDIPGILDVFKKRSSALLNELLLLVGHINENDYCQSELYTRYSSLNINNNSIKSRLQLCIDLLSILSAHKNGSLSLHQLSDFIIHHGSEESGFNLLNSRWKKSGPDYETKMPNLPEIISILEKIRVLDFSQLKTMLAVKTIHDLKSNGLMNKIRNGLISYDDMVLHVYTALQDEDSIIPDLLRKKYQYALVDEFQDTDMLQWAIFKIIFLQSDHNRLFVIGDPKQAIYGFRGADIHAYLIAREDMITSFKARFYSLSDNWRSSPRLIHLFNELFGTTNWFTDRAIQYLPSTYPIDKNPALHEPIDSMILVNCGSASGTEARQLFSDFIAREISIILARRICNPEDIAILVTKWREAEVIEHSLKKASIKYSFYKKEGLFQTKESLELAYITSALADFQDMNQRKLAFATRFFNIDRDGLRAVDTMANDHPALKLLEQWRRLAEKKKWSLLYQSMIEDSGILYRTGIDDHDRQILNYKSIMQVLEIEAYRKNHGIYEVTAFLNSLRLNKTLENEASNIQKLDLDRPGIQILTMHASKGLEFKIVIIGGGFTGRERSTFWTYHKDNIRFFDLLKEETNRELFESERTYEEERLFYVAITRARDRVYIPFYNPTARSASSAGLLGNKISRAISTLLDTPGTVQIDVDTIQSPDTAPEKESLSYSNNIIIPEPLLPDPGMIFLKRTVTVDSFSGLKVKLHGPQLHDEIHSEFEDRRLATEDEYAVITDISATNNTIETYESLPHGIETGLMLHEILEKIDYSRIRMLHNPDDIINIDPDNGSIIKNAIINNMKVSDSDITSITNTTSRIIWNTLHTVLNEFGFSLSEIEKKIHEVEFHFPVYDNREKLLSPHEYIHGYIDMVFEYKGKYFLVDWKSNYLEHGYSYDSIKKNISDMHYDIQINIYIEALIRWIKRFKRGYSYDKYFGGVYYLYLRGIDPQRQGDGVFFYRPDCEPVFNNSCYNQPARP